MSDFKQSIAELDHVVDADSHVSEPINDIIDCIDEGQYSGSLEILSHSTNPVMDIYSNSIPTPGFVDRSYDIYDVHTKFEQLEEFGITHALVGPTTNLNIASVDHPQLALALANGYNSWVLKTFLEHHDRLYGHILVSHHKPDQAVKEIDRLADKPSMKGIYLPGTGTVPPLGDERYDPIYEAASRHDMPVVVHASIGASHTMFPTQTMWNETYAEEHVITHPFTHMWNLTTMLFRGVPERFPDVTFVFQEAGIGWIPYLLWRLDDHYLQFADELPYLNKLPSEYVVDQFYFTTQPLGHTASNGRHLAWAIEMAGPESIMYSSDLPHTDFDPPEELFDRIRSAFDDDVVANIMGETAMGVFDLQ